jgi:hypothetical protein
MVKGKCTGFYLFPILENMEKFIIRIGIFVFTMSIILELFSRLCIDPMYFASIDTYNIRKEGFAKLFGTNPTTKVDYLFIGTSRVPATINDKVFCGSNNEKAAVVAGRGYMTAGIHYQALQNRLKKYPQYLNNAIVFLEYPDPLIYTNPFSDDELRVSEDQTNGKSRSHLILPHLDWSSFCVFISQSKNSLLTRLEMIPLFISSAYRTSYFLNEQWIKLEQPIINKPNTLLATEGGIRNDNIDFANQLALEMAEKASINTDSSPVLTYDMLNRSSLNKIASLVKENNGKVCMYEIPLHSLQNKLLHNPKLIRDKEVFEEWLKEKDIAIIRCSDFKYCDNDFPDTWHLSKSRRDEFSMLLFNAIKNMDPAFTEMHFPEVNSSQNFKTME